VRTLRRPPDGRCSIRTLLQASLEILQEIQPASVRAVCYRLLDRLLIPNMTKTLTNWVSHHLARARESPAPGQPGLIPWEYIVDESRPVDEPSMWGTVEEYFEDVQFSFRRDPWQDQPRRLYVLSEKGTVSGTVRPVTRQYGVPYLPVHGFGSVTKWNDLADRIAQSDPLLRFILLYLGDWDPSGLRMSEDNVWKKVVQYLRAKGVRHPERRVAIRRVALVQEDLAALQAYDLLDRYHGNLAVALRKNTNLAWYQRSYALPGRPNDGWELDSLSPAILRARLDAAIQAEIDGPAWERAQAIHADQDEAIREFMARWARFIARRRRR
jgi:hypothetical protein